MSLLDELKAQADRQQQTLDSAAQQADQRRSMYLKHLNPRMKLAYAWLREMVGHLNLIAEKTAAAYIIPGKGLVEDFEQRDYRIHADNSDEMREIRLGFRCRRERPVHFLIEDDAEVERIRDQLSLHRLSFDYRNNFDVAGRCIGTRFEIEADIPVSIHLQADPDNLELILLLDNFPDLNSRRFRYRPHELNQNFMDDLGRFVLRQDDLLIRYGTNDLGERSFARRSDAVAPSTTEAEPEELENPPRSGWLRRLFSGNDQN